MQSKLSSWCDGLIEAGILAAVITAPLFFNIHSDRVFEPDKLTIVRSIAVIMAGAWLVRFVDQQGWRDLDRWRWGHEESVWRVPFALPVLFLVIVYIISTIFSVVPRTSWAGSYQRLQGTYTTLSYIVIFALAMSTIRRREQVNRLVTAVIITSIPISLYGLLQHYGLDPLPWGGNVQERIAGHMGNAIFIAAYLIMAVPLTVIRIVDAFTNILSDEELSYADVVRSSVYIFTVAIQLVAIYWSGSRGPMLGLMVGMFALVLILLVSLRNAVTEKGRFGLQDFGRALALVLAGAVISGGFLYVVARALTGSGRFPALAGPGASLVAVAGSLVVVTLSVFVLLAMRRGWRWLWMSWLLLAALAVLWLGLFNLVPDVEAAQPPAQNLSGSIVETVNGWRDLPVVGRFGRMLDATQATGRVRVLIWEGALELVLPHEPLVYPDGQPDRFNFLRPIIGYGPESMYVAYNRFYVPELASIEARNASPDRSHNETFDALIITGMLGFLVWQILYLSVFYYGFRWLRVVRSKRDRNLLIGLWIVGAIVGAAAITSLLGPVYIGVAIPFGSIGGLALYLAYYALFGSTGATEDEVDDPFQVDRLLMMGLVAAVVAHYVEIHFGIAIAATRVHFFVYVALMALVGHVLPRQRTQEGDQTAAPARARVRGQHRLNAMSPTWSGPVIAAAYILTLIVGTLAFEFMNYAQPPNTTVETLADVPSVGDIFHQAFFVHPGQGFIDSPFIFLMIMLTWILGTLASLSELMRQGIVTLNMPSRRSSAHNRYQTVGSIFVVMVVAGLAMRFVQSDTGLTVTRLLGQGLSLIWMALCLLAALLLFRRSDNAEVFAGCLAATGLGLALPVAVAGSTVYGLLLLLGCGAVAYFIWDGRWRSVAGPGLVIAMTSLLLGLSFAYLHANRIRTAVFFGPPQPMGDLERLIFSADRFAGFVTLFYVFLIALLFLAPFAIARARMAQARSSGSTPAFGVLALILVVGIAAVTASNLRIIQADIVYKQGRPLDNQASRSNNPQAWEAPIALYERAIDLASVEDFYYLFLGRAYLEQSAVTSDPGAQQQLLETAYARLQEAQRLNPLNTDHTANLARLMTRWASLNSVEETRRAELLDEAKAYYRDALVLSPQNSVIRNELGNLLATLDSDCQAAIDTYERSLEIDPYYVQTYLGLAGVYEFCAARQGEERESDFYLRAANLLEEVLERSPRDAGAILLQSAELYRQAEAYDAAIGALERAGSLQNGAVPSWMISFRMARIYQDMGDAEQASMLASEALTAAPVESRAEIQTFLNQLGAAGEPGDPDN